MTETTDFATTPLRHICEVCGKDEIMLPEDAFNAGWDYPPRAGVFGLISPRVCGDCPINKTVWWALMMNTLPEGQLSEAQMITVARIKSEPESITLEK